MIGRPRANATAYRIIAAPFVGILHDDQFWTDEEWYRQEALRRAWRKAAQRKKRRGAEAPRRAATPGRRLHGRSNTAASPLNASGDERS